MSTHGDEGQDVQGCRYRGGINRLRRHKVMYGQKIRGLSGLLCEFLYPEPFDPPDIAVFFYSNRKKLIRDFYK